jgi:uncharacterized membrane protein
MPSRAAFEIIAGAGLLFHALILVWSWFVLPGTVPVHFGITGEPDDWAGKESLLVLGALSLGLYIFLTWLNRRPQSFNYPVRITEHNRERQYRTGQSLISALKAEAVWLLAIISWCSTQVALGRSKGLSVFFLLLFVVLILSTVLVHTRSASRAR